LEERLKNHERRVGEMNKSWEELGKRKSQLEEKKSVLRETAGFFNEVGLPLQEIVEFTDA
jgi:V-type H+-transporting ATPase subunit a